jgi:hypothetical protein
MIVTRSSQSSWTLQSVPWASKSCDRRISSPKANAICERVIGTIRRECLDWMIPVRSPRDFAMALRRFKARFNPVCTLVHEAGISLDGITA